MHTSPRTPEENVSSELSESIFSRAGTSIATTLGHALKGSGKLSKQLKGVVGEEAAMAHAMAAHLDELARVAGAKSLNRVSTYSTVSSVVGGTGATGAVMADTTPSPPVPRSRIRSRVNRESPDYLFPPDNRFAQYYKQQLQLEHSEVQ